MFIDLIIQQKLTKNKLSCICLCFLNNYYMFFITFAEEFKNNQTV